MSKMPGFMIYLLIHGVYAIAFSNVDVTQGFYGSRRSMCAPALISPLGTSSPFAQGTHSPCPGSCSRRWWIFLSVSPPLLHQKIVSSFVLFVKLPPARDARVVREDRQGFLPEDVVEGVAHDLPGHEARQSDEGGAGDAPEQGAEPRGGKEVVLLWL